MGGAQFNIGSQQAGNISNVAGDQHVSGGQHGVLHGAPPLRELEQARRVLAGLSLPPAERAAASAALDEVEQALEGDTPQPERAASALQRAAVLLRDVGAVAAAGASLTQPLAAIARWLGGLGAPVLRLLQG